MTGGTAKRFMPGPGQYDLTKSQEAVSNKKRASSKSMGLKLDNQGFLVQVLGGTRNRKPGPGSHNIDANLNKAKGGYIGQKIKVGGIIKISKHDASPASYQIDVNKK
jgi:hypothetical protein